MSFSKEKIGKAKASVQKAKDDVLSVINAFVTMCDNFTSEEMNTRTLTDDGNNPFNFLVNLSVSLGVFDKLPEWLEKFLIYEIPALELSMKGILINTLISKISCLNDPRIPNKFRLTNNPSNFDVGETSANYSTHGMLVDLNAIDYMSMLDKSPFSDQGKNLYFGTKYSDGTDKSPFDFVRADDMNAFLWFVIHYVNHTSPVSLSEKQSVSTSLKNEYGENTVISPEDCSLMSDIIYLNGQRDITAPEDYPMAGTMYKYNGNNFMESMCISSYSTESDREDNKIESWYSTIVPATLDDKSTNWYTNIKYAMASTVDMYKDEYSSAERDETWDIPVLYARYFGSNITTISKSLFDKTTCSSIQNKLQIAVLPKPTEFYALPVIRMALFDHKGKPSITGKYSCALNAYPTITEDDMTKKIISYELYGGKGYLVTNRLTGQYYLSGSKNSKSSISDDTIKSVLYPCYPKITVYSLFFDLIMGMRLLDSKTLAAELINSIAGLKMGGSLKITSSSQSRLTEVINTVMENIMNEETTNAECFFNFSNEKYDEMISNAEEKRKNYYSFNGEEYKKVQFDTTEINDILSEYSDNATKEEKLEILNRAFTKASNIASNVTELSPSESSGIKTDIITQLIKNLISSLVCNLMSPKISLLIEMQKQIMGDDLDKPNAKEWLNAVLELVTAMAREIMDFVVKKLLSFILVELRKISACMIEKELKEQLEMYRAVLKQLISSCSFSFKLGKSTDYGTTLDEVDYADINDTTPINENC